MFDVSTCCLALTFVSLVSVILSVIGRLPQLFFSWFHMHFHAQTGDNASTVSKAISGVSSLGSGVRWGPMGSPDVSGTSDSPNFALTFFIFLHTLRASLLQLLHLIAIGSIGF